jgi:hypothetical protein
MVGWRLHTTKDYTFVLCYSLVSVNEPVNDKSDLGVYCTGTKGEWLLVHQYGEGDYGLEDIPAQFRLGNVTSSSDGAFTTLELSFVQLQKLKVLVDAYSFDYEPGFIEMCLDMYRFGTRESQPQFQFMANF